MPFICTITLWEKSMKMSMSYEEIIFILLDIYLKERIANSWKEHETRMNILKLFQEEDFSYTPTKNLKKNTKYML